MADFGGGELDAFRAEAKTWLEANFPASLRKNPNAQLAAMMGGRAEGDAALWQKRMGDKGWGTPTWPKEYGGGGLSRPEARVLQQEMARIGAENPIQGLGPRLVRPTH